MSTPKINHKNINEVKNSQVQNSKVKPSKNSEAPKNTSRFKKSSGKDKKKAKKISNNFHFQSEHNIDKKLNRQSHLKSKIHDKHKYRHNHHLPSEFTGEKFQPGYSSEPDVIEYSLDRSWLNHASFNQSLPENLDMFDRDPEQNLSQEGISNTFQSRHFVKLPKLVYYNGQAHYSRSYDYENAQ